jgi:hypothetical protein
MKFTESRLCQAHEHCTICRQLEKGREWRTLAARIYEMDMVDFACPYGIGWLEPNQIVDPSQFKVQPKVNLPKDNGQLAEAVLKLDAVLRERLPVTSSIIKGLNVFAFESRHGSGCSGCRRKSMIGQLGQAVRESTLEDQAVVSELLSPV